VDVAPGMADRHRTVATCQRLTDGGKEEESALDIFVSKLCTQGTTPLPDSSPCQLIHQAYGAKKVYIRFIFFVN